jgi:hypothetical protein
MMMRHAFLLMALTVSACLADGSMALTVSMPQAANHSYHVTFRCEGFKGELKDFKMPSNDLHGYPNQGHVACENTLSWRWD